MNQIKKPIITLSIRAVLLALIPYMALWLDKYFTHIGIGIIVLSWFTIYPVYFLIVGIKLGKYGNTKRIWSIPLIYGILIFLTNMSVTGFDIWIYYVGYLAISYIALGCVSMIERSKHNQEKEKKTKRTITVAIIILVIAIISALLPIVLFILNVIIPSNLTTQTVIVTQETKGTSIETLYENRTEYIGDNSAVGNLINELSFPSTVKYDKFELQTEEEPYALTVYFTTDSGPLEFYKDDIAWDGFYENQIILFSLIGNVEKITFDLRDDNEAIVMTYQRKMAEDEYGDLFERTETLEGFYELQDELFLERNAE